MIQNTNQDPYAIRTHTCGQLRAEDIGERVVLCGWVAKRRDLGGFIFIDLRDRTGIIQLALNPKSTDSRVFQAAETVRPEWPLMVEGTVQPRPDNMVRDDMDTGAVEVALTALEVLNTSDTPPFHIEDGIETSEDLRMRYRYLDLRRPEMHEALALRDKFTFALREALHNLNFLEVETPILGKSTPEGARDFLVPSRMQEGDFYALPQSPQLLKELLMVSGIDRYYQLARCFRDEDLRADRQPEFTQLDLEMSYVDQGNVMACVEEILATALQAVNVDMKRPLRQLKYWDAMDTYGSDKPDTRFEMLLTDISTDLANTECGIFSNALKAGGVIKAICCQGAASWGRSKIEKLEQTVKDLGGHGLAWLAWREGEDKPAGPISKFLSDVEIDAIKTTTGANTGDLLLIVADTRLVADTALGALRLHMAEALNIPRRPGHDFLWVIDFPMFERDEETGRITAQHHPFTLPQLDQIDLLEKDPLAVGSYTYDFVMDGCEAGGGGLRIHNADLQLKVLKAMGFSEEEAQSQFGFLLEALSFGAPPMGGFALGLDRVCMLLAGASSIRDVMAFPKTTHGNDLMLGAPAQVSEAQKKELGL